MPSQPSTRQDDRQLEGDARAQQHRQHEADDLVHHDRRLDLEVRVPGMSRRTTACTSARACRARSSRTARRPTKQHGGRDRHHQRHPLLFAVEPGRDELPQLPEDERARDQQRARTSRASCRPRTARSGSRSGTPALSRERDGPGLPRRAGQEVEVLLHEEERPDLTTRKTMAALRRRRRSSDRCSTNVIRASSTADWVPASGSGGRAEGVSPAVGATT